MKIMAQNNYDILQYKKSHSTFGFIIITSKYYGSNFGNILNNNIFSVYCNFFILLNDASNQYTAHLMV